MKIEDLNLSDDSTDPRWTLTKLAKAKWYIDQHRNCVKCGEPLAIFLNDRTGRRMYLNDPVLDEHVCV